MPSRDHPKSHIQRRRAFVPESPWHCAKHYRAGRRQQDHGSDAKLVQELAIGPCLGKENITLHDIGKEVPRSVDEYPGAVPSVPMPFPPQQ